MNDAVKAANEAYAAAVKPAIISKRNAGDEVSLTWAMTTCGGGGAFQMRR
jgi:hypothetical protein